MRIVEEYSERNKTYVTDRLAALSGLTKQFKAAGAGLYLAGLWSCDLIQLMTKVVFDFPRVTPCTY